MLIACITDTQDDKRKIKEYFDIFKSIFAKADIIIHLGDGIDNSTDLLTPYKKVIYIKGNHDLRSSKYLNEFELAFKNFSIYFFHGQRNNKIKEQLDIWKNKIRQLFGFKIDLTSYYTSLEHDFKKKANVIVYGHIHIPKITSTVKNIFFCPGGMPGPRLLFGNCPSIGTIEINDGIAGEETVKFKVLSLDNGEIIETQSFERIYVKTK